MNSDGSMLAYNNNNGRLAIVEVQTGNEINVIEAGGFADIGYPIWSPDDSAIATFFGTNIELYNALPPRDRLFNYYDNFTTSVSGFDWSENSNIIVYSTRNAQTSEGTLAIIQVLPDFEMELVKTIDAPAAITVSLSDDGTAVAINTQHGVLITNVDDESQLLLPKVNVDDAILSLDWSADGTKIAAGGFKTITIWNTQTREIVQSIEAESIVSSVVWSPDGQYIYHTGGTAGVYRDGLPLQESILQFGNQQ